MLCTFPFEKKLFEDAGLRTEFVGHPLVDDILAHRKTDRRDEELIGLFPGSRRREIERHFPIFLELVTRLHTTHPDWRFETSASSAKLAAIMEQLRIEADVPAELINIAPGSYHDLMDRSHAALVTSGTATLEAALHELPFVLVYKVAAGTYWVARVLLKIKYLGMVNILVNKEVVRELVQHEFNTENCIAELERLMNEETRARMLEGMQESIARLGHGGAAGKAADAICSLFPSESPPQ